MRRKKIEDFENELEELTPWEQYLQAKWTAALYERFPDIQHFWQDVRFGDKETKDRANERLSNLLYEHVLPKLLHLFGEEIATEFTFEEFYEKVAGITGIDVDKDEVGKHPALKRWAADEGAS